MDAEKGQTVAPKHSQRVLASRRSAVELAARRGSVLKRAALAAENPN